MTDLLTLAAKLEAADAAYQRTIKLADKKGVDGAAMAFAAGCCLMLHGHLFGEAAAALKARGQIGEAGNG